MSGSVEIRGGVGGVAVGLDALDAAAGQLAGVTADLVDVLASCAVVCADPVLQESVVLSPITGGRADAELGALVAVTIPARVARVTALAVATRSAAALYRAQERVVEQAVDAAHDAVMREIGGHLPEVLVGAGVVGFVGAGLGLVDPSPAGLGRALDREIYAHPEVADLGGGMGGLVDGVAADPRVCALVGCTPTPAHSDRYHDGLHHLAEGLTRSTGMLSDAGSPRVLAEPVPRKGAKAPRTLAGLASDLENLSDTKHYPGHVRVIELPQPDGSSAWLVEVSGTQVWNPRAGSNPFDVTSDVHLMADDPSTLAQGTMVALERAQAAAGRSGRGDPVMVAGHSQGGIVGGAIAATPELRAGQRITHVVTLGSPVARMPIPDEVQVLSLEHVQDPVPRLEGRANPDRGGWVTVTRDLTGDAHHVNTGSGAHDPREYAETAAVADGTDDASVRQWRQGSRQFFATAPGTHPVIRDFRIERVPP